MSDQPWFKFWSTDYLCDPKVDALPLEAQGFLVRLWCVCNQRGSIPDEAEEIARLTQCRSQSTLLNYPLCKPFFVLRDGRLFSKRMEAEKEKSRIARENASKKKKADGSANGSAGSSAQKARRQESQEVRKQLPISDERINTIALTACAVPASPAFIVLLLNDKTEYPIGEKLIAEWESLYPAIDVRQELRNYKGWSNAKPERRKTRKGIRVSVNSWLSKAQGNYKSRGENSEANRARERADANADNAKRALESIH